MAVIGPARVGTMIIARIDAMIALPMIHFSFVVNLRQTVNPPKAFSSERVTTTNALLIGFGIRSRCRISQSIARHTNQTMMLRITESFRSDLFRTENFGASPSICFIMMGSAVTPLPTLPFDPTNPKSSALSNEATESA